MRKSFCISGTIVLLIFAICLNSFGDNQWVSIGPEGGWILALAIDPQTPDTLYAGTYEHGVFKSTNGGASWTQVNTGLTDTSVYALAINPQTPDTLYAGTYNGGVFKSTNGGTSWTEINTGLTDTSVYALAINPQTPDTLYAGTNQGGVFKSTNGGASWTTMNTGLTNTHVYALAINPQIPETLYAGTDGGGAFKTETVIYVSQDGVCGGKSLCFTTIQNGIDSANNGAIIKITQETYNENVVLNSAKELTLQGGWDSTFTTDLSNTTINGSLTISNGSLILDAGGLIVE